MTAIALTYSQRRNTCSNPDTMRFEVALWVPGLVSAPLGTSIEVALDERAEFFAWAGVVGVSFDWPTNSAVSHGHTFESIGRDALALLRAKVASKLATPFTARSWDTGDAFSSDRRAAGEALLAEIDAEIAKQDDNALTEIKIGDGVDRRFDEFKIPPRR